MKTCKLMVSVRARHSHGEETEELCSGHRLEVTENHNYHQTRGEEVLCITERGAERWIQEEFISHAA